MKKKLNVVSNPVIHDADYHPAILPEHAGNPLIETLPQFHRAEDMIDTFGRFPLFDETERQFPDYLRMFTVLRLNDYLEPLPTHMEVIEKIGLIVRTGYVNRNPIKDEYRKSLNKRYHDAMNGKICPIGSSSASTAPSIALFGVSGVGKTSVVERALDWLPQIINHKDHGFRQVVWMKLDCPPDGSLKQLLLDIIGQLDALAETNYADELGSLPVNDRLITTVGNLLASHHVGLLVIDEIQNVLDASGIGQAKMLNSLVTYANVVKIPTVVIGTPKAMTMIEKVFRGARRVGDHGTYIWDALPFGDEWALFMEGLWQYQWTQHKVELTEELSKTLHNHTQGIHVLAVRLFQFAQLHAIRKRTECITKEQIEVVAGEKFKLIAPMLDALKSGKKKAINQYEDLLHKGLKKMDLNLNSEASISLLRSKASERTHVSAERMRAISSLVTLGFDQNDVQRAVTDCYDSNPTFTCEMAVRTILLTLPLNAENAIPAQGQQIKEIVQTASATNNDPMTALAAAGLIEACMRKD